MVKDIVPGGKLPWLGIAAVDRIAGANMVRKLAH
jgi:hypothetical protein